MYSILFQEKLIRRLKMSEKTKLADISNQLYQLQVEFLFFILE